MASAMARRAATNYRYLTTDHHHKRIASGTEFEFEESDVWGGSTRSSNSPDPAPPRSGRKVTAAKGRKCGGDVAASMPVNIPNWSRLGGDEAEVVEEEEWLPPHEYVARTRPVAASFSVHEGIGRTLKGRDLSRVRNAIWEITGFQD